jgi:hypothetical protein
VNESATMERQRLKEEFSWAQGGVEGRLPWEIGAFLMPLLVNKLISVSAETCYALSRVDTFTQVWHANRHPPPPPLPTIKSQPLGTSDPTALIRLIQTGGISIPQERTPWGLKSASF